MSLLAEVLSTAEAVELKEINEKVPQLNLKIEMLKSEIIQYMENVYINFSGRQKPNKKVFDEVKAMEKDICHLKNNLEQIRKKQLSEGLDNVEKHNTVLGNIEVTLVILSRICDLNEGLVRFNKLLKNNEYLSSMKLICELENLPSPSEDIEHRQLFCLDEILLDILAKKTNLTYKLETVFFDDIIVKCLSEGHVFLKVKKDISNLQETLKSLYFNYPVISCLSSFSNSLWKYLIIPVVDNAVTVLVKEDGGFNILEIKTDTSKNKSMYQLVFSNLITILKFLKSNIEFTIIDNVSVMKLIGDDLRENLSELIIKHCLEDTIPSTTDELKDYDTVIQDAENFEKTLKSYAIFEEDSSPLGDYTKNIAVHYINKKCKEYFSESEAIMKKDLHNIVQVGIPYNSENPLDFPDGELPQCCVSKSTMELIKFLENMLQAALASEVCKTQLLYTVRNIIIKYGAFVPEYHSKLLQTIPQQVAIFQNNCVYINHEVIKWEEKFFSKLSPKLADNCSFVEPAHQVSQIGVNSFTDYVLKAKGSLGIVGIDSLELEQLSGNVEKSVRQYMREQELLKTEWHKVLSYPLYNKTIGNLLDTMCLNVINAVVNVEHITSKAAAQLVEVFKIIVTQGPKLFTDPKEIKIFVPSWYKFNELNFVLGASLIDVNDRWADGKGPLALQFKPAEMRSLIKALFQNTDRRAAVLARI